MLNQMLTDSSLLVRVGVAAAVTFFPLYILQSMGYKWPFMVAIIIFIGLLTTNVGRSFLDGTMEGINRI